MKRLTYVVYQVWPRYVDLDSVQGNKIGRVLVIRTEQKQSRLHRLEIPKITCCGDDLNCPLYRLLKLYSRVDRCVRLKGKLLIRERTTEGRIDS